MSWKKLLTTAPPNTVWLLDDQLVAVLRRDSRGAFACAAAAVAPGTFALGPVGLQSVDSRRLGDVVRPLNERIGGARRAAVVVPTAWARSHLLEFNQLPRGATEIDETIRWRLKKLLPVLPTELRVSTMPQGGGEDRRRILCTSGLERAYAALEEGLSVGGTEPGLVVPRLFAWTRWPEESSTSSPRLVVQHEPGFLSVVMTVDGIIRFLRTKPLPDRSSEWTMVRTELGLALAYVRHSIHLDEEIRVLPVVADESLERELRRWWEEQDHVVVEPPARIPPYGSDAPVAELGAWSLGAGHAILLRGAE